MIKLVLIFCISILLIKAVYFHVHRHQHRLPLMEHLQVVQAGGRKKVDMSEAKPKIEGAKNFCRPARAAAPTKKEFATNQETDCPTQGE
jgi:hypothetical protein